MIDTPGTGDIFQRFDRDVQSILEEADAVIFTISALSPLSLSEQNFLQLSLLPQDFPKVFFVVNMLDCVRTDEEAERLLDAVKIKIDRLFPQAQLFGISARDEFTRILSLSRPNIQRADVLETTFADFRATLEDSILINRDLIQLHRIASRVERDLSNWKSQIILLQESIQSDRAELDRAIIQCQDESSDLSVRIEQHKQQMKKEIKSLSAEAIEWIDDFFNRLQVEAVNSLAQYQLADIHRHYNFFLADSIQKAVASCLDVHRPVIIDILNKSASNIAGELHLLKQFSFETLGFDKASLEQYQCTNLDTLQAVIRITSLGAITDLLIHQVKKSHSNSKVSNYHRQLQKSLPLLKSSLCEQVSSIYCNFAEQLEKELDIIAQSKIDASISIFKQAQNLSIQEKRQISVTNKKLDNALSVLIEAKDTFSNFQQKLWS